MRRQSWHGTQDLDAAKEQLLTDLAGLDSHLQAQTFLVGDTPSLADVAIAVDLRPAFEKVPAATSLVCEIWEGPLPNYVSAANHTRIVVTSGWLQDT